MKEKVENLGAKKSFELRELAFKSQDNIISLDVKQFNYYVNEHPRPYDIVTFYTSTQIEFAKNVEKEFLKVIQAYKVGNCFYPQFQRREKFEINENEDEEEEDPMKKKKKKDTIQKPKPQTKRNQKPAIYFVKLEFQSQTKELFSDMGFTTVPNMVITRSKSVQMKNPDDRKIHLRDNTWQFAPSDGVITSQKILDYINNKTQKNIQFQESILNLFISLGFLGLILLTLKFIWDQSKSFLLKKDTQFIVSIILYNLFLGGLTHTIINNSPWYMPGPRGQIEWFSKNQRMQYGLEGLIVSFLLISIALLFVYYIRLIKNFDIGRFQKNLLGCIVFYLIIFLIQYVQDLFRQKQWYNPMFWPPQEYIRGPLSRDQGVTF